MAPLKKGVFAIYKPKGPTSHDIVAKIKQQFRGEKVGHAGTLDPLASGILVVGVGRDATKELRHVLEMDKEYSATIRLGAVSETDDSEGPITEYEVTDAPSRTQVEETLATFIGLIKQMPPTYSSVKRGGKPAHRYARAGKDVLLGPRFVEIKEIELLDYQWPEAHIRVICGSGTYIRSLARDVGQALKVGGYLAALERTRIGEYTLDSSIQI